MRSKFLEIAGQDGGLILLRADKISVINIPSRLVISKPGEPPPSAVIIIDSHTLHFPVAVGEHLVSLLNKADEEDQRNRTDLTGNGPSRN